MIKKSSGHVMQLMLACGLMLWVSILQAEVVISDAWVRASNPGQSVAAAYLALTSKENVSLVYVETVRAGTTEIHSMSMQNGVMKMRHIEQLAIPANKTVKLAPGSLHMMLFDLPNPFKAGEQVKFRLCFKDRSGNIHEQFISMPVRAAN